MPAIVSWIREKDEAPFASFFAPHPGFGLLNGRTGAVDLGGMDALLLTGGPDVGANWLRQPLSEGDLRAIDADASPERDAFEFGALNAALERGLPILAVCKGTQLLNVALGGTLHLDIRGHDLPELATHNIQRLRFAEHPTVRFEQVNSSHHQALDRLGEGLEVEAWCAADGVIEQVRLRDYPFALGVQYHPERDMMYAGLFERFIAEVRS